ncbi:MAG TPA: SRPBCC family protein [Vicinamibacteria bacterium]
MGLRFEHAFVIKAPAAAVWAYLTDPYRVAPALPGAAITEKVDEQTYKGTITMKVGPVSARYKGTVRFEKLDAAARVADIVASGQDVSGRGGADMKMTSRLVEKSPSETEVNVVSEVSVTGILAQFGRGLMQDVSNQMLQRFTEAMRSELETAAGPEPSTAQAIEAGAGPAASPASPPASAAPPIEVISFGSQILGQAAVRALGQPIVWVVAAAAIFALYWLWSR